MTTQNHESGIPEGYWDLLKSTALAHVATVGPGGERVVDFVKSGRTTRIGA